MVGGKEGGKEGWGAGLGERGEVKGGEAGGGGREGPAARGHKLPTAGAGPRRG